MHDKWKQVWYSDYIVIIWRGRYREKEVLIYFFLPDLKKINMSKKKKKSDFDELKKVMQDEIKLINSGKKITFKKRLKKKKGIVDSS